MSAPVCSRRPWLPLVGLALWGCSAAESAPPSAQPAASSSDAAPSEDAASSAADAGVAAPGAILNTFGKAGSCAESCAQYGFACTDTCTLGNGAKVIGTAEYSTRPPYDLGSCTEDVPPEKDGLRLQQTTCCCTAPVVERVVGALPPQSCRQICATRGLRCDPKAWKTYPQSDAVGESTYRCSGDRIAPLESCDAAPPSTLPGSSSCSLRSYYCSCLL